MAKKPQQVGPSFGGKNFFPTHQPRPITALLVADQCIPHNAKRRLKERVRNGEPIGYGLFVARPVVAHRIIEGAPVTLPVCIHRGVHVNTRHNRDYIAPKKVRVANGEWNGGAA